MAPKKRDDPKQQKLTGFFQKGANQPSGQTASAPPQPGQMAQAAPQASQMANPQLGQTAQTVAPTSQGSTAPTKGKKHQPFFDDEQEDDLEFGMLSDLDEKDVQLAHDPSESATPEGKFLTKGKGKMTESLVRDAMASPHANPLSRDDFNEMVVGSSVVGTAHLKNWQRFKALREKIVDEKNIKAKGVSMIPTLVTQILSQAKRTVRDYEVDFIEKRPHTNLPITSSTVNPFDTDCWLIALKDSRLIKQPKKGSNPDYDRYAIVPVDVIEELHVDRLAEVLCDFINRAPINKVSLKHSNWTGQLLLLSALQKVDREDPEKPHKSLAEYLFDAHINKAAFNGLSIAYVPGTKKYEGKLHLYDNELEKWASTKNPRIFVYPEQVNLNRVIPQLPERLRAYVAKPATNIDMNNLSGEELQRHRMAQELIRYIQVTMFGSCANSHMEQVKQAQNIANLYLDVTTQGVSGYRRASAGDVYSGKRLLRLVLTERWVAVGLASGPMEDIKAPPFEKTDSPWDREYRFCAKVIGRSKERASYVAEAGLQCYMQGNSLFDTVDETMRVADQVNTMPPGARFAIVCRHRKDGLDGWAIHWCQVCWKTVPCGETVISEFLDVRVCLNCDSLTEEALRERAETHKHAVVSKGKAAYPEPTPRPFVPGARLRKQVTTELRIENPDLSFEERRKIADRVAVKFMHSEQDETWTDHFINTKTPRRDRVKKEDKSGRIHPFQASWDSASPVWVDEQTGAVSYHTERTGVTTAQYVNYGTNTWLKPALLCAVEANKPRKVRISDPRVEQVVIRMDHNMAVRTKFPYHQKTRKLLRIGKEWPSLRDQIQTGVLSDPAEEVPAYIEYTRPRRPLWDAADRDRLKTLMKAKLESTEQRCNAVLRNRSVGVGGKKATEIFANDPITVNALLLDEDGAPFPFWPDHRPEFWDWDRLEGFIQYHYDLLWFWCDRHFTVEEVPENLFLELIWQWIDRGGRGHFLAIPWVALVNHPAGVSFGHEEHGRAMRTSFPPRQDGDPLTRIRDVEDGRCNMSIETRMENYMKMDYGRAHEGEIRADLENVRTDSEWMKPVSGPVARVRFQVEPSGASAHKRSMRWIPTAASAMAKEIEDSPTVLDEELLVDIDNVDSFEPGQIDLETVS